MKTTYSRLSLITLLLLLNALGMKAQFSYISPMPGSQYHHPTTNIILRNGNVIDEPSLSSKHLFTVTGSLSGNHDLDIKLAEEGKTILLQPVQPFAEGETVTVQVADGIRTMQFEKIQGTSFSFQISPHQSAEEKQLIAQQMQQLYDEEFGTTNSRTKSPPQPGLPNFTILTNTNPTAGEVFFHNFQLIANSSSHICIIENNGDSVYGKFDTVDFNNFDLNHNGFMTVYNRIDSTFDMLDSNYNKVAAYQMGNGFKADVHEFQIFSDNTRYMVAYDPEIVDMTVYNINYCPHATVVGAIVQKLDKSNNVVFQWRSWDHFNITDAQHINLANCFIDAVHLNSIDKDTDGNIIISSRHLDEISKINISNGNFIWRLGGANNQFTFINDPQGGFNFQHDVRRIANGDLTVFDNGNYNVPPQTFAKEYLLDEVHKNATLVWSYTRAISSGHVFSSAMGSIERLANGNTFICWGLITNVDAPSMTELDPQNNVVWEMKIANNDAVYRSHRFTWDPCSRPTASTIKAKNITSTTAKISWKQATGAISYEVQYRPTGTQNWKKVSTNKLNKSLKKLTPATQYEYQVRGDCSGSATSAWTSSKKFTTLAAKETLLTVSGISFDMYPNPTNGSIHVEVDANNDQPITFTVYDLSGKVVFSSTQQVQPGGYELNFNLNTLPKGMYLTELKSESGKQVEKLVVE